MRLGILSQYYPPEIGASQVRLSELAARFLERGHEVSVLTAMPNYPRGEIYPGYGGLFRREERNGVDVLRTYVYPTKSLGMAPRMAGYLSFVASSTLAGAAALPRVDYLMTESPPLFLGMAGYVLSRLKRSPQSRAVRWIFNVSDLWPDSAVHLGLVRPGLPLRLAYRLEAFCYRHAWLVSGQNRGILDDIRLRFPGVPTYHLSNGVDPERFQANGDRRRFGLEGECVALYAGLLGAAQGLEQILEAAERLRDLEALRIYLVGDGPEKERLLRQTRERRLENVRFLDPLPREEMPQLLASVDISLACLKQTLPGAVPSKIYEAMGAGRPIVLVADGEPAEIVRTTGSGMVVDPGDIAGLAAALRQLTNDAGQRGELAGNGRRAAETLYHRRKIADAFIDHLERGLAC